MSITVLFEISENLGDTYLLDFLSRFAKLHWRPGHRHSGRFVIVLCPFSLRPVPRRGNLHYPRFEIIWEMLRFLDFHMQNHFIESNEFFKQLLEMVLFAFF